MPDDDDDVQIADEATEDEERHLLRDTGSNDSDTVDNTIVPPG